MDFYVVTFMLILSLIQIQVNIIYKKNSYINKFLIVIQYITIILVSFSVFLLRFERKS